MGLAQTRAAVVAESTGRAPASRPERVFQVPVGDNAAVVVIHRWKIYHRATVAFCVSWERCTTRRGELGEAASIEQFDRQVLRR